MVFDCDGEDDDIHDIDSDNSSNADESSVGR